MGKIIRGISKNKTINIIAIEGKDIVEEARKIQQASPVAIAALGRCMCAAAMMGALLKEEHATITLQVKGNGPLGLIACVADSKGAVKAYVSHPQVILPVREEDNKLDVARAVGKEGSIAVIRDLGLKQPYIGQYEITSGEIAEDLTAYYANSEQIPSSVALGVLVDRDYKVKAAGGFIVQLMPDVNEEDINILEKNIANIGSVSHILDEDTKLEHLMERVMEGLGLEVVQEMDSRYYCDCSRERVEKALISIGKEELNSMIQEDGKAEVNCHFCNNKYQFSKAELEQLRDKAKM